MFTPKSLLREPAVMSPLSEFNSGSFQTVLPDEQYQPGTPLSRVVFTTGKIGVELRKLRDELGRDDVSIVRLEQLYPLPQKELERVLKQYPAGVPAFWAQEEPRNMGACYFMKIHWEEMGFAKRWPLTIISRPESASPSTGSKKAHKLEEKELFEEAFGEVTVQRTQRPARSTA